ncbi:aldehyde dehydrogenase [Cardiosporidium cionae]|uniref:Aldehyde dehydrogenase n=1 Tax=Cardiosporidium cionae TaxID=476202 RepID=A0ABQ7JFW0_9APIC|nr:aldehyde dehydrogenase [Cardiosporidium cionae]|eukprot:KAF8822902.1 aldehyde dehydrogenase [Cardiosporidium cionae]
METASKEIAVGSLPFETRLFIDGEFVEATSNSVWENINPATEEVLTRNVEASHEDVDKAIEAARRAFETWQSAGGKTRRDLLNRFANLIEKHREQLALAESLDNGKPMSVALAADLALVVDCFRYYAGWADKIQGKTVPIQLAGQGDQEYLCLTKHEPVGVVGQIIPWNFPLLMLAWKLAPAIAVGCTIVMKTSEKTPLTAQMVAHLIKEAGFPPGVVNILTGFGPTVGDYIVRHPGIDKVAFTGSSISGKKVMIAAAESGMKRISLELGGKSPLIVFDDADLDAAVEIAQFGLFFNQGQCCIASSRIFVQENIYDKFLSKAAARARNVTLTSPQSDSCTQGPQVDKIQYEKILKYIEQGKREGATCVTGGQALNGKGYYIEPTVFGDVNDDMVISKEEIFGPVMTVLKFKTVDEAIARANATSFGLGAGVCTKDLGKAMTVMHKLKAGTVYINCWDIFDCAAPFGGYKQSGQGRELGEYGLQPYIEAIKFTQVQTANVSIVIGDKIFPYGKAKCYHCVGAHEVQSGNVFPYLRAVEIPVRNAGHCVPSLDLRVSAWSCKAAADILIFVDSSSHFSSFLWQEGLKSILEGVISALEVDEHGIRIGLSTFSSHVAQFVALDSPDSYNLNSILLGVKKVIEIMPSGDRNFERLYEDITSRFLAVGGARRHVIKVVVFILGYPLSSAESYRYRHMSSLLPVSWVKGNPVRIVVDVGGDNEDVSRVIAGCRSMNCETKLVLADLNGAITAGQRVTRTICEHLPLDKKPAPPQKHFNLSYIEYAVLLAVVTALIGAAMFLLLLYRR